MRTYYVLNAELSFGFGGFICKAFTLKEKAEQELKYVKSQFPNITEIKITEVQAKNKEEAQRSGRSMFTGEFKGIDRV